MKVENDPIQFVKEAKFLNLGYKIHIWTSYQIPQTTVSKIPDHPESPLSYRMGCRSNYIIETISLPG